MGSDNITDMVETSESSPNESIILKDMTYQEILKRLEQGNLETPLNHPASAGNAWWLNVGSSEIALDRCAFGENLLPKTRPIEEILNYPKLDSTVPFTDSKIPSNRLQAARTFSEFNDLFFQQFNNLDPLPKNIGSHWSSTVSSLTQNLDSRADVILSGEPIDF